MLAKYWIFLALACAPATAQAQDDFFAMTAGDGTYQTREEMNNDQAIVRPLFMNGIKALQDGRYETARQKCSQLNEHFFNSRFMEEKINIDASQASHECLADARYKLGDVEGACRVYAEWGYTSLLEDIDPSAVCSEFARSRAALAQPSGSTDARLEDAPEAAGLRQALDRLTRVRRELIAAAPDQVESALAVYRSACGAISDYSPVFGSAVKGIGDLCLADAFIGVGDVAAGCTHYRRAAAAFQQAGPTPRFFQEDDELARRMLASALASTCR
jgi:hypothetical protein